MKRTISLLLVAVLMVACMTTTAFAAQAGETAQVTIYASGEGFANFSCSLSYDSKFTVSDPVFTVGTGDFFNNKIAFAYGSGKLEGSVAVLTLNVAIDPSIAPGDYYFTGTGVSAYDDKGNPVDLSVSGKITIICEHVAGEEVIENNVDPTCTEDGGYDKVVRCVKCNTVMSSEHVTVPALGHDFGEWVITKAATCTEAGEQTRTCAVCGVTETETIPAAGHKFGEWTVVKAVTCTEDGSEERVCPVCGAVETRVIPAVGHDWQLVSSTKGETCQDKGLDTYKCSNCGETKTEPNDLVGDHVYSKCVANEGKHTHNWVCVYCGVTGIENEPCYDEKDPKGFCDACGQEMPKTDPEPTKPTEPGIPPTGDITPYPVFILMAVAAVMAFAYGFKRKFVK